MSAVAEAKEYLRLMRTLPLTHFGPLAELKDPRQEAALSALAKASHAEVTRIDERTYRAPSVWHAAAWMLDQAALIAHVAARDGSRDLTAAYKPALGAPVFRGQRNPAWRLDATIFRSESVPADLVMALELFIAAMTKLMDYEENRMNNRFVHMAGAQHYGEKTKAHDGLPTPLLDFTADPHVAIYFACRDADPAIDREVAVYGMPLGVLGTAGGRIILPPPWLKRLWAQRGLFLDCTGIPHHLDLRELCFQLRFPPDNEFARVMFEQDCAAILPNDPWFERAIAWAIAAAKSLTSTAPPPSVGEWLRGECGDPPFRWYALMPAAMQESSSQLVDLCEWLALKVVDQKLVYDLNVLDLMLKDNEPLFRSERVVWQYLQNVFPTLSGGPDRALQLMNAIGQCVEQAAARQGCDRS